MKKDKNWIVYKHTSPCNKVYIGITCQKPSYRWGLNGNRYLAIRGNDYQQPAFARAIIKYGWDNIRHELILTNITKDEAVYAERYLIKWYKLQNQSYNIGEGGDGVVDSIWTDDRRLKCSEAMKQWHSCHVNPMKGRHHTEESRSKISKNHKQHLTDETKKRISKSLTGKPFPQWRCQLLSDAHAEERIPVVQLTLDGEFIAEYISIMDAQRSTGIHNAAIAAAVKRKGSAKGFKWLNKNDYEN